MSGARKRRLSCGCHESRRSPEAATASFVVLALIGPPLQIFSENQIIKSRRADVLTIDQPVLPF